MIILKSILEDIFFKKVIQIIKEMRENIIISATYYEINIEQIIQQVLEQFQTLSKSLIIVEEERSCLAILFFQFLMNKWIEKLYLSEEIDIPSSYLNMFVTDELSIYSTPFKKYTITTQGIL